MSSDRQEGTGARPRPSQDLRDEERQTTAPRTYLRTVYPLNPGIPHFVDFPRGWK